MLSSQSLTISPLLRRVESHFIDYLQEEITMQIAKLIGEIKSRGAKRIMLQLPEGLRMRATTVVEAIEKEGIDVILSADATYGACDIADSEAAQMHCDLLVHVGHSKFYRDFETCVPVIYYPWEMEIKLENIDFSAIKERRIGLVTTIQHMKLLKEAKEKLEKQGKEVVIGGQILGCWTVNADKLDVDAYLFVGTGHFHPTGVKGTVYSWNLEKGQIEQIDTRLFEKKRYANIYNAKNAHSFAILVSSKEGQRELLGYAEQLKSKLQQKDKKAFIVIMDEIRDSKLMGIKVDAFVNTACPRLTDDAFSKPFVNASDIDILLEE